MDNFREERLKNPNQFCIAIDCERGHFHYDNLESAKHAFVNIEPEVNGKEFTNGMYNGFCEQHDKHQMLFEDWHVYGIRSI